ncbi:MAG: hypothetical protein ACQETI_09485 [Halobacteriota archaeon]
MAETHRRSMNFGTVGRTRRAIESTLRRRDSRWIALVSSGLYLAAYLYAIGHLGGGDGGVGLLVVSDPLGRAVQPTGFLSFEPVARVSVGVATLLVAPVNVAIGSVLSLLVGVNLAVSYLAWRQPAGCGIGGGAGVLAGLPALLSGAACCGPVVLIALGVQASGILLATFEAMVPVAALLLVGSLLYVGRRVDPVRTD